MEPKAPILERRYASDGISLVALQASTMTAPEVGIGGFSEPALFRTGSQWSLGLSGLPSARDIEIWRGFSGELPSFNDLGKLLSRVRGSAFEGCRHRGPHCLRLPPGRRALSLGPRTAPVDRAATAGAAAAAAGAPEAACSPPCDDLPCLLPTAHWSRTRAPDRTPTELRACQGCCSGPGPGRRLGLAGQPSRLLLPAHPVPQAVLLLLLLRQRLRSRGLPLPPGRVRQQRNARSRAEGRKE